MKLKKIAVCVLSAILALGVTACKDENDEERAVEINRADVEAAMPTDTLSLWIEEGENAEFIGFGAELDPQFVQHNVGRTGTTDGQDWECSLEDWENVIVPRIREMNLKKIRVMLLPSWFATSEAVYQSKNYTYDSEGWQSLELVLDVAQEMDMYVNVTMWGIDAGAQWMGHSVMGNGWITVPKENGGDEIFCNVFADALEYLIDEKGYTCIREVTPYNEPDTIFRPCLGNAKAFNAYADLCYTMDEVFRERGLRERLKFNLSDDANNISWLESSVLELSDIADYFNSHSYAFGNGSTNENILGSEVNGAFGKIQDAVKESGVPHMLGELGTDSTQPPNGCVDRYEPSRGIDVSRIAINALNSGSVGANYWVLFSQYYSTSTNVADIMSMGLWGFADENYECRPVYYAYSLLTRFTEAGSTVYPIRSTNADIAAVALKKPAGKWTYLIVNTAELAEDVSFGNAVSEVKDLSVYTYSETETYSDGEQIASDDTATTNSQVTTYAIPGNSFVVLTEV